MEFTQSVNTNTLEAAYHSEGRVLNNGTWEYNLKDHLGNVRIVFVEGVDRSGKIVQENHYYPFGMQQNGNWVNNQTVKNDYLYNGKELNTEIGLNWSDYGFRYYDATIARWVSPDPLAEFAPEWTPYRYGFNNPISYIDPNGLFESKEAAQDYADDNNIKTGGIFGIFRKNKIVEQSDGTWGIENKSKHSVTQDLGKDLGGVQTFASLAANDIVSTESNYSFFSGTKTIATKRDGSTLDISPQASTIDLPVGPGGPAKGLKALKGFRGSQKVVDKLVKKAKKLYPKKANKDELHHITPKYLGGAKNGALAKINAAYHQLITNAFRRKWPYRSGKPNEKQLKNIMKEVYEELPLPPGSF